VPVKPAAKSATTAAPALPPVAVFVGPERFLQLQCTEELVARVRSMHGDCEPMRFDAAGSGGTAASPAEILDECRSMSLMQSFKVVIVENADVLLKAGDDDEDGDGPGPASGGRGAGGGGGKSAREMFEGYAKAPERAAMLVLRAPKWRPGNLDKAVVASGGVVVKCEELSLDKALAWVSARAAGFHQVDLEPMAARRLVATVGSDLGRLDCEIAKLAIVHPGKPITEQTVAAMTAATREEEFWAIQPTLLGGDIQKALAHLHELVEVSRHDPTPLTFTYMDLAKKLHSACRGLRAGESRQAIAGRLKLWGPTADVIMAKAGKLNPVAVARLMGHIVDGTVRSRTGLGDAVTHLEQVTIEFASLCRV